MSWPVTLVDDGGAPVVESPHGTSMTPVAADGTPVVLVSDNGTPVKFVDEYGQISPGGAVSTTIIGPGVNAPLVTVTRSGTATYFDAAGELQDAAANTARIDYHPATGERRGLRVEESRTNSLRNNTQVGAALPSTLPTNWSVSIPAGLTTTVTDISTYNGIPRIRLRISGTASATSYVLEMDTQTGITAAATEVWTGSIYTRLIDATLPPVSHRTQMVARTAAGASVATNSVTFTPSSTLARTSNPYTLPATTERVQLRYSPTLTIGQPYDFTIDIMGAQVELGAYASSLIKTSGSAVTRNADVPSITGSALSFFNATEGTFYIEFQSPSVASAVLLDIGGGGANERMLLSISSGSVPTWAGTDGGVGQWSQTIASIANDTLHKVAAAYKADDVNFAQNGTSATADTSATIPTIDRIFVGVSQFSLSPINGWIKNLRFFTSRVSDANLDVLTT